MDPGHLGRCPFSVFTDRRSRFLQMKLIYLINSLGAGGAERSLAELLPFYDGAGIRTRVVCLKRPRVRIDSDFELTGSDVEYLDGSDRAGWIRSFRQLIAREQPRLIHTTLFDSHIVGRLGAVGTGVPVLSSLVNTAYDPSRKGDRRINPLGFRIVRTIDGWTARNLTTHFHAITRAVRDAYISTLGLKESSITVIERGRNRERLGCPGPDRRRKVRTALGITEDQEVLINVGRQEYQKAQPILLEAVARLVDRRPNLVLLIAGREGNLTDDLRSMHSALGLGDRVRFLGHRTDVADLLAASDIFVFPSHFEGLGGALIEAMALGLPAVVSDIPALREVAEAGRSADLVPAADPQALAESIDRLLDDPRRMASYGQRGREIFAERFEIKRCAERMIDMYRGLAA